MFLYLICAVFFSFSVFDIRHNENKIKTIEFTRVFGVLVWFYGYLKAIIYMIALLIIINLSYNWSHFLSATFPHTCQYYELYVLYI